MCVCVMCVSISIIEFSPDVNIQRCLWQITGSVYELYYLGDVPIPEISV